MPVISTVAGSHEAGSVEPSRRSHTTSAKTGRCGRENRNHGPPRHLGDLQVGEAARNTSTPGRARTGRPSWRSRTKALARRHREASAIATCGLSINGIMRGTRTTAHLTPKWSSGVNALEDRKKTSAPHRGPLTETEPNGRADQRSGGCPVVANRERGSAEDDRSRGMAPQVV